MKIVFVSMKTAGRRPTSVAVALSSLAISGTAGFSADSVRDEHKMPVLTRHKTNHVFFVKPSNSAGPPTQMIDAGLTRADRNIGRCSGAKTH